MRWRTGIAIGMLVSALQATGAEAQAPQRGDEVRVELLARTSNQHARRSGPMVVLRGRFDNISDGRLTADFGDLGMRVYAVDSISKLEVRTRRGAAAGMLRGMLWGAGASGLVGFVIGAANPEPDSGPWISEAVDSGLMAGAVLAVPGTLIGALIGAVVPGAKWRAVDLSPHGAP